MTTPTPEDPGRPEPVDWDRYETELGHPAPDRPGGDPAAVDGGRVLVDSAAAQRPPRPGLAGWRAAQRRPILPAWARSRAELAQTTRWAAGFAAHTSAYHLTRTPKYTGKLAARAPRGATRLAAGWLRWLFDTEGEPVRQATVRAQDAEAYLKLTLNRPEFDGDSGGWAQATAAWPS